VGEVHTPTLVRAHDGIHDSHGCACLATPRPTPHGEAPQAVEPVDLLMIDEMAFAPQHHVEAAVTEARTLTG
jgi:hypothetical protein